MVLPRGQAAAERVLRSVLWMSCQGRPFQLSLLVRPVALPASARCLPQLVVAMPVARLRAQVELDLHPAHFVASSLQLAEPAKAAEALLLVPVEAQPVHSMAMVALAELPISKSVAVAVAWAAAAAVMATVMGRLIGQPVVVVVSATQGGTVILELQAWPALGLAAAPLVEAPLPRLDKVSPLRQYSTPPQTPVALGKVAIA